MNVIEFNLKNNKKGNININSLKNLKKLKKLKNQLSIQNIPQNFKISKEKLMEKVFLVNDDTNLPLSKYNILIDIFKYINNTINDYTKKVKRSNVNQYLQCLIDVLADNNGYIDNIYNYITKLKEKLKEKLKNNNKQLDYINWVETFINNYIYRSLFSSNTKISSTYIFIELDDGNIIIYKYIYIESKLESASLNDFLQDTFKYNAIFIDESIVQPPRVYKLSDLIELHPVVGNNKVIPVVTKRHMSEKDIINGKLSHLIDIQIGSEMPVDVRYLPLNNNMLNKFAHEVEIINEKKRAKKQSSGTARYNNIGQLSIYLGNPMLPVQIQIDDKAKHKFYYIPSMFPLISSPYFIYLFEKL